MRAELVGHKQRSSLLRAFLFASKPSLFIALVVGAILATAGYKLRTESIFACPADGYSADRYLAYCHATGYADYEYGAFWFELEPSALKFAADAEVMFLGDSRLEIALSTPETADWFTSISARYYLLGFGYGGNTAFTGPLLRKIRPRAGVYVINVDPFLTETETTPAKAAMHDNAAPGRYEIKRLWQILHKSACGGLPALCGDRYVVFRSRSTGAYQVGDVAEFKSAPVSDDESADASVVAQHSASGRALLSSLSVRPECVILTAIPTVGTELGTGKAVAQALGLTWVAPQLDGLRTFDGSHLDRPSAERWSKAFLDAAGPRIRSCLGKA
jgi:hypothetical protein